MYTIHLLLHLADSLTECGPLIGASQHWVAGYIGWIVDRSNARTQTATAMLNSILFFETYKVLYVVDFRDSDETAEELPVEGFM